MNNPLISIIIPVYNGEKYLSQCLDSIAAQTYTNFECLIVNDGSRDGSAAILDGYAARDGRFKVFHKENGGVSSARNLALAKAAGEWITFVDADDILLYSNGLEEQIRIALETNADITRGRLTKIEDSFSLSETKRAKKEISYKALKQSDFYTNELLNGFFIFICICKKSCINEVLFKKSLSFGEDIDFLSNIFSQSSGLKCVQTELQYYGYRSNPDSATQSYRPRNLESSFMICDIFYQYSESSKDEDMKTIYLNKSIDLYFHTLCSFLIDGYYENRAAIIDEIKVEEYRKRTKERFIKHKIFNLHSLFSLLRPEAGIQVLRLYRSVLGKVKKLV